MERRSSILQVIGPGVISSCLHYPRTAFSLKSLERQSICFCSDLIDQILRFTYIISFIQVIQRFFEAGLTRKWLNDEMDAVHILAKTLSRPELEPFSIDQLQVWLNKSSLGHLIWIHLKGGFYILALGLMASLVSIAIEWRHGKRQTAMPNSYLTEGWAVTEWCWCTS